MKLIAFEENSAEFSHGSDRLHLRAEALRVWELYQAGAIREMYFREDRPDAVLVLECKDSVDAAEVLASLPLVRMGLTEFKIIPLRPYPGFSRLMESLHDEG